jgi:hypothetical protein
VFAAAEPMMKAARLEFRGGRTRLAAKLPFPKRNPVLDCHVFIFWRTKEMNMIGHHDIGAD